MNIALTLTGVPTSVFCQMTNANPPVAYALRDGVVHLCLLGVRAEEGGRALCAQPLEDASMVPVDPDDLGNLPHFIICKACAECYTLMGYGASYGRSGIRQPEPLAGQLALF